MKRLCLHFQFHLSYAMKAYFFDEIGSHRPFVDEEQQEERLRRIAEKTLNPIIEVLTQQVRHEENRFHCSISISGITLQLLECYAPETLTLLKTLVNSEKVALVAEPYHYSLAFLFNKEELVQQVRLQVHALEKYFGKRPTAFQNTEGLYDDRLVGLLQEFQFNVVLGCVQQKDLEPHAVNYVFQTSGDNYFPLLIQHLKYAKQITSLLSLEQESRLEKELRVQITSMNNNGEVMYLPISVCPLDNSLHKQYISAQSLQQFLKRLTSENTHFFLPSQIVNRLVPKARYSVNLNENSAILAPFLGSVLQREVVHQLYQLCHKIMHKRSFKLLAAWRILQTVNHLLPIQQGKLTAYTSENGSCVNKYFDAYITFKNILKDLDLEALEYIFEEKKAT